MAQKRVPETINFGLVLPSAQGHRPTRFTNAEVSNANNRGVYSIKRRIAPESTERIMGVMDMALSHLAGKGIRRHDVSELHVTIVGFANLDYQHLESGPSSSEMIEAVPSSHDRLEVELGSLALFNRCYPKRLGVSIVSRELVDEFNEFERQYSLEGFDLYRGPWGNSTYEPHVSIAEVRSARRAGIDGPGTLLRINELTGLREVARPVITLERAKVNDPATLIAA